MRGKKPTSYGGRFLAPSVIAFGLVFSEGSAAQDIPQAFTRSCLGVNFSGYRFHPHSCPNVYATEGANQYLSTGINYWYDMVDNFLCGRAYRSVKFTPAEIEQISASASKIYELDTDELQAVANCNAAAISGYTAQINSEADKIYAYLQAGYSRSASAAGSTTPSVIGAVNNILKVFSYLGTYSPQYGAEDVAQDLINSAAKNVAGGNVPDSSVTSLSNYLNAHDPSFINTCAYSSGCGNIIPKN